MIGTTLPTPTVRRVTTPGCWAPRPSSARWTITTTRCGSGAYSQTPPPPTGTNTTSGRSKVRVETRSSLHQGSEVAGTYSSHQNLTMPKGQPARHQPRCRADCIGSPAHGPAIAGFVPCSHREPRQPRVGFCRRRQRASAGIKRDARAPKQARYPTPALTCTGPPVSATGERRHNEGNGQRPPRHIGEAAGAQDAPETAVLGAGPRQDSKETNAEEVPPSQQA